MASAFPSYGRRAPAILRGILTALVAGMTFVAADAGSEQQQPPPAATQTPAQPPAGGRQGGRGVFPQQQRTPGDPALIERGRTIYRSRALVPRRRPARRPARRTEPAPVAARARPTRRARLILPVVRRAGPTRACRRCRSPSRRRQGGRRPTSTSPLRGRQTGIAAAERCAAARRARRRRLGRQGRTSPRSAAPAIRRPATCRGSRPLPGRQSRCRTCGCRAAMTAGRGGRGGGRGGGTGPIARHSRDRHTADWRKGRGPAPALRRLHRHARRWPTARCAASAATGDRPKVEIRDPLQGHRELLAVDHRQGHARRDGLPGDAEMTRKNPDCSELRSCRWPLRCRSSLDAQGQGVAPADLLKPLAESWPTYSGDYTGRRYSSLKQINRATVKNLTLAWVAELTDGAGGRAAVAAGAAGRSSSAARARANSSSPAEPSRASALDRRRHDLRHDARQRLGDRRARRARALALLLEDPRRHAHRQSRPRHVERLPLHGDARQLSRLARGEDRQGTLAQGHRRLQPAVLLDDGADRHRQPRHRRHRQRPRLARVPAVVRCGDRRAAVEVLSRCR